MATAVEEDVEYESDPEEVKRSLAMRRRAAASDDEEGEEKPRADRRAEIHSDESDDQGGAAEYDDDDEELVEDEEEEIDEEEEEVDEEVEETQEVHVERGQGETRTEAKESEAGDGVVDENGEIEGGEDEEEKKENEPFAVPTAGAFYMHDDRFRDNAGGRSRYGS